MKNYFYAADESAFKRNCIHTNKRDEYINEITILWLANGEVNGLTVQF